MNRAHSIVLSIVLYTSAATPSIGQSTIDWLYLDTEDPRPSCRPLLEFNDIDNKVYISCLYSNTAPDGRLYNLSLDAIDGEIDREHEVFNPAYNWIELYGASFKTNKSVVVRDIVDSKVRLVRLDSDLDTTASIYISSFTEYASSTISVDDKIYMVGYTESEICLVKVNPSGSLDQICIPNPDWLKPVKLLLVDGSIYVGLDGSLPTSTSRNELAVMKFDTAINHLWTSIFYGDLNSELPTLSAIHRLEDDVVIVGKNNEGFFRGNDIIVVRINGSTGDAIWDYALTYNADLFGDGYFHSFVSSDYVVHIFGAENENPFPNFGDNFFFRLSKNGDVLDSVIRADMGFRILDVIDINDMYVLFGYRSDSDYPLIVLDGYGDVISEYNFEGLDSLALNRNFQVTAISSENFILSANIDFDYLTVASVLVSPVGIESIQQQNIDNPIKVFPNPSRGGMFISCSKCSKGILRIFEYNGVLVHEGFFDADSIELRDLTLSNGLYVAMAWSREGEFVGSASFVLE